MTLPYYASAEQIMRDRSELAKKGIARGKSVVVLTYDDGVLFVAENPSRGLHKISEIYDRIGFAAVGKYNEFEVLRRFGIQRADRHGYEYDRQDVTGQFLANLYALYLGSVFTEHPKPYEVEICVAEVSYQGVTRSPQLFKISYDGSISDESHYVVMGGAFEPIVHYLKAQYKPNLSFVEALKLAVTALGQNPVASNGSGGDGSGVRTLAAHELEVATLEHNRDPAAQPGRRTFTRIHRSVLQKYFSG